MKDKKIKILADCPPPLDESSLTFYKDAGIDIYVFTEDYITYDKNPDEYLQALKLLNDMQIDVYMRGLGSLDKNYFSKFESLNFYDYPCIKGFYITDEPSASTFDALRENYVDWKNEKYKDLHWHLNLLPSYAANAQLGTTDTEEHSAYENYIISYNEEILKKVKGRKDISFDHYSLLVKEGKCVLGKNWLSDIYTVGQVAMQEDIDFCVCIQSFTDGNGWRILNDEAYFRFQFNTYLAFGANMFEVFLYRTVHTDSEGVLKGMIENDEKTEYYTYVQETIKEVRVIEQVYLSYDWKGISIIDGNNFNHVNEDLFRPLRTKLSALPDCIKSLISDEDCLVGIFEKEDKIALMIVNFNDPINKKKCNIHISMDKNNCKKVYLRGNVKNICGFEIEISIDSGDGVFIEIEK